MILYWYCNLHPFFSAMHFLPRGPSPHTQIRAHLPPAAPNFLAARPWFILMHRSRGQPKGLWCGMRSNLARLISSIPFFTPGFLNTSIKPPLKVAFVAGSAEWVHPPHAAPAPVRVWWVLWTGETDKEARGRTEKEGDVSFVLDIEVLVSTDTLARSVIFRLNGFIQILKAPKHSFQPTSQRQMFKFRFYLAVHSCRLPIQACHFFQCSHCRKLHILNTIVNILNHSKSRLSAKDGAVCCWW